MQELSYRVVHLIEEAFGIPVGTFDAFFQAQDHTNHISPQHRIKLVKYPPSPQSKENEEGQGVGAHKDSSGWLTLLLQVGQERGLEVLDANGEWIAAPPIDGTFVVNFGNALEAATEGAVRATIHRVKVGLIHIRSYPFADLQLMISGQKLRQQAQILSAIFSGIALRPHCFQDPVIYPKTR